MEELSTIKPVGSYVLIRPDKDRDTTSGGIALPSDVKIPVLTGRVLELGPEVIIDSNYPFKQYSKVIFRKGNMIPVDIESLVRSDKDDGPCLVPAKDVIAYYDSET